MSGLMSDGFVEAKRVSISLLMACLASYVLSTENRKKMLRRAPSRSNLIKLRIKLSSLTSKKRTVNTKSITCAESFRSQQ